MAYNNNIPATRQPDTADSDFLSRRSFLKLGVAGTVVLSSTSMVAGLTGCSSRQEAAAQGFAFLRDADLQLFKALLPAVLGDVVHADDTHYHALEGQMLLGIDGACANLGQPAQGELTKLFDLLHLRLARWLTTGIYAPWAEASQTDLHAFLQRWRSSSLGLFNAGYRVLTKLVTVTYYSLPESRRYSGYPGPLANVYQIVNS